MTTTLVVIAHPEPSSFTGTWAKATCEACTDLGHVVQTSDLYQMKFDPVEGRQHFATETEFDPLKAQETAATEGNLPIDVSIEVDKIRAADRVVFHFPIWWFGPPAILKGWLDRVLVHGALHDVDRRFDQGMCRGKTAVFCITSGADENETAFNGKEGDLELILWPLAYTLRYLGFDVARPIAACGVHGYHEGGAKTALETRLKDVLASQNNVMARFEELPLIAFNADSDFDRFGRLLPDRESFSPFIRHKP